LRIWKNDVFLDYRRVLSTVPALGDEPGTSATAD
jgi:hypothetical protein